MAGRSFRRIRLGQRLQELRDRAGVSREAALAEIEKPEHHPDTLRKVETGDRFLTLLEITTLGRMYGCSEGEIAELRTFWREASEPSAFASFGLPENVVAYLDLERAAIAIRVVHGLAIPGMLQAPSYARRLFELSDVDAAASEQRVQARLKRQQRLQRSEGEPDPVQLIAVIGEEALARAGADQLAALSEFAKLPNIEIRIISLGVGLHAGIHGDFTHLEFPPGTVDPLVYLETAGGGQVNDTQRVVGRLRRRFEELLRGQALGRNESLALITELLNNTR